METDELHHPYKRRLSSKLMWQYADIAEKTAVEVRRPETFTCEGLCTDAEGNGLPVWTTDATCKRDALGWLLVVASEILEDTTRTFVAACRASDDLGQRVYELTGRSIIELSDDPQGSEAVAVAFEEAAASYREEAQAECEAPLSNRKWRQRGRLAEVG